VKSTQAGFAEPVPFGQYNVPDEASYRSVLARIEDNGYFTNHGPLAKEFEASLAEYLGVAHVVLCTNESLGMCMALKGMQVQGNVLVPALGMPELVESVVWAGHEPVFCDVDADTHQISPSTLEAAATEGAGAVVILEIWGNRCDADALVQAAERCGLQTLFYAPDSFGSARQGKRITRPDRATLFSFQSARLLSTMEGGCLATDDAHFAAVLRNIRSSYGAGEPTPVPVTANGRFSELQAGLGLWGLEQVVASVEHNRALADAYGKALSGVAGLSIYGGSEGVESNFQCLVLHVEAEQFGLSRDGLQELLAAEQVSASCGLVSYLPKTAGFPVAERLARELLLLPVGAGISTETAATIGGLVAAAGRAFS
jgi:dTDP-4-amino-4,6-dideoxygalactose transaminase